MENMTKVKITHVTDLKKVLALKLPVGLANYH